MKYTVHFQLFGKAFRMSNVEAKSIEDAKYKASGRILAAIRWGKVEGNHPLINDQDFRDFFGMK
jgi:hypothetical protein